MDKPYPPSASRRRALLAQGLAVREPTVVRFFAVAATLLWVAERGSGRLRSWQTWFLEACAGSASVETLAVACARDLAGTLAELAGACALGALCAMAMQSAGSWAPAWRRRWQWGRPAGAVADASAWAGAGAGAVFAGCTVMAVVGAAAATGRALMAPPIGGTPADLGAWVAPVAPLLVVVGLGTGVMALLRWQLARERFDRVHGMTRRELLDELKAESGDPAVRRAQRERMQADAAPAD